MSLRSLESVINRAAYMWLAQATFGSVGWHHARAFAHLLLARCVQLGGARARALCRSQVPAHSRAAVRPLRSLESARRQRPPYGALLHAGVGRANERGGCARLLLCTAPALESSTRARQLDHSNRSCAVQRCRREVVSSVRKCRQRDQRPPLRRLSARSAGTTRGRLLPCCSCAVCRCVRALARALCRSHAPAHSCAAGRPLRSLESE